MAITTRKTFCRFCHVFCGLEADVDEARDRVVAIRGDRENAVSRGYTCAKGRAELERLYHPERLAGSRKRVDGRWTDIAPQRALDEVAERLRAIVDEHGARAVACYVGNGGYRSSTGGPWLVRRWLDGLGSPGLYSSYTIDSPSLSVANYRFFGAPMPLPVFDIDHAGVAMFVATDPVASHLMTMPQSNPHKRLQDAQKRGMKLIVIDPRRSLVARRADIHLQVRPGEDATLLAALVKVILDRKLHDLDYVDAYVSGVEDLHRAVADFDLDYAEARSGVPAAQIEAAAELFARSGSGVAQSGTGLHMARHQNLTTQLVMTLNGLCGRYDRRGGLTRNAGVLHRPLPENPGPIPLPLYFGPTSRMRGIRGIRGPYGFKEMPTNTLTDEILEPGDGQIRALIVSGGNPALTFPDREATRRALQSLELLVVNDLFLSATVQFADYVFAVKHPFERVDVPRLMDASYPMAFSQYAAPLVRAGEHVLEEWEIFWELAHRLGTKLDVPGIDTETRPSADQVLDGLHAGSRIPLDEVRQYPGGHVWGEPETLVGGIIPNMIGHPDRRMAAGHPEVLAELREVRAEPVSSSGGYAPGEAFAFRMITYRLRDVYCTQGANLPSLRRRQAFNPVLMNAQDVTALGLEDGAAVVVDSGYGRVAGVVECSERLAPGVVGLAFGWEDAGAGDTTSGLGSCVQHLIPDDRNFDPITGLAQQSAVPVNVYPR